MIYTEFAILMNRDIFNVPLRALRFFHLSKLQRRWASRTMLLYITFSEF